MSLGKVRMAAQGGSRESWGLPRIFTGELGVAVCSDTDPFLFKRAFVPTRHRPHTFVAEDTSQPTAETEF